MSRIGINLVASFAATGAIAAGSPEIGPESLGATTAEAAAIVPYWPKNTHPSYAEFSSEVGSADYMANTTEPGNPDECRRVAFNSVAFGGTLFPLIWRNNAGKIIGRPQVQFGVRTSLN